MYTISIDCTSKGNLCFINNVITRKGQTITTIHKISKRNYENVFKNILIPFLPSYINRVYILYKEYHTKNHVITTKTLQFSCIRDILNVEFQSFIHILNNIGFRSVNDTSIKYYEHDTEPNKGIKTIYKIKFHSMCKLRIRQNRKKNTNVSKYKNSILYKKT